MGALPYSQSWRSLSAELPTPDALSPSGTADVAEHASSVYPTSAPERQFHSDSDAKIRSEWCCTVVFSEEMSSPGSLQYAVIITDHG